MDLNKVGWVVGFTWVALTGCIINCSPQMLTLKDYLLMMPQWCEMKNLNPKNGYMTLAPQATLWYSCITLVILSLFWFLTSDDDVEELASDVVQVEKEIKAKEENNDVTEKVLLENTKCLLENVDLEYRHCAATIAANNETPGQKVGGESEWATGETSSEEEDATREITGAKIRKRETEDEQIMRFLQEPFESCTVKEPQLRKILNETGGLNKFKTK